jgi:ADP-heptose:LPS heptosyltransferase
VDLIDEINDRYPHPIVLTGAPFEKEYLDEITEKVKHKNQVLNYAGKTSIIELGWVLKHARVMITTDSGNAHYANAVGTPSVVLFGAGLQSRCHPYNKDILRSLQLLDLECVPCRSEQCKYGDNRCLTNIENEQIFAALDELIKAN